jgi:hypothetical protein
MSDNKSQPQENIVSQTVSALAIAIIDRTLRSGKSISIPSLGIVIKGDKQQAQQEAQRE